MIKMSAKMITKMAVVLKDTILVLTLLSSIFSVICQPMVPVVSAQTGKWILPEHLSPMLKPGGHGAIWKLMLDKGVFQWLENLNRQAALVRQIRYKFGQLSISFFRPPMDSLIQFLGLGCI